MMMVYMYMLDFIIMMVQQNREKTYKVDSFKTGLDAYAKVVSNYIKEHRLIQTAGQLNVQFHRLLSWKPFYSNGYW